MSRARGAAGWALLAGGASLAMGLLWASRARASTVPSVQDEPLGPLLPEPHSDEDEERITGTMLLDAAAETAPPQPSDQPLLPDPEVRDIEAGARMIASENPRGGRQLHIEQLWTQIRSAKPGQSLFDRITAGSGWGAQGERRSPGRTRPVASGNSASDAQRQLVRAVLRGSELSILPGARKFFDPEVQDRAYAIGERARAKKAMGEALTKQEQRLIRYKRNAAAVRASWAKTSRVVGSIEGVEFWT